jgi:spermidine synthase
MMTDLAGQNPYFTGLNQNSLQNAKLTLLQNHALIPDGREKIRVLNQKQPYTSALGDVATVNIINLDAALFVEQISGLYDIIIIDFPDPNTPELSKLYSKKFYSHIAKKLSATGIMVQQATSPVQAREAFLCIGRSMRDSGLSVIPFHDNVPSFGEWGWWIGGKREMISEENLREKLKSIQKLEVAVRYLTPALIRASLQFGKDQLATSHTDINTVMSNRLYDYYIEGWQRNF